MIIYKLIQYTYYSIKIIYTTYKKCLHQIHHEITASQNHLRYQTEHLKSFALFNPWQIEI